MLAGFADGTLLPFIPLFLLGRGLSAAVIGAILAASALAALIAGLTWSYLADRRFRPERMVVLASIAAALAALLLTVTNGAVGLTAVIVVLSVARAPFMLLDPITLRRLRRARRTEYARIRLRMSAGWALSATVVGATYQLLTLRLMPLLYPPLALLFGAWVRHALQPGSMDEDFEPRLPSHESPRHRALPLALAGFLVSSFLLGASLAATQNFLTVRISVLGGGAFLVGVAAALQAATEIPTMGYTHVITRRISHRTLFAMGCALYFLMFVGWAFTSSAVIAALLKLAAGVAFALIYVASVVIADELSPPSLRATGQAAVKSVSFGLAPIAGALGGGLIYGLAGARAMFLVSAVVVAGAGVVAVLAVPAHARRSPQAALAPAPEPAAVTP